VDCIVEQQIELQSQQLWSPDLILCGPPINGTKSILT